MSSNRGKRRTRSTSRSHPYDMGNINNWYSEQFRAKLAEWNIIAPASYTKAELKSLYVANLSNRSDPNQIFHGDSMVAMSTESTSKVSPQRTKSIQPVATPVPDSSPTETSVPNIPIPSNELQTQVSHTDGVPTSQNSVATNVMVNMMSTMTSMMQQVFEKDGGKNEQCRKTLDQFSANRSTGNDNQCFSVDNNNSFGLHPEQIKHTDFVSESLKEKIVSGKYVNMVLLLIPEYEQMKENKDRYRDARLNRSLSIEEFIVAFGKYKRIHCISHPWRKAELDAYESYVIDISRVYGRKFYEYHKIFSQKCAMALEQGIKVNWAEKDKDLLLMILGGTQCITCNICKEVSHTTPYCPQNVSQFGVNKYQNPNTYFTTADNNKAMQRKPALCHYFNGPGCVRSNCMYVHACKRCNSISHGQRQCIIHQIPSLSKSGPQKMQQSKKN